MFAPAGWQAGELGQVSGAIDSHQVYKDGEIASKRFSVVIWLAHTEPTAFQHSLFNIHYSLFTILACAYAG